MKKPLFILTLLCLAVSSVSAQGYSVYVTNKVNIRNAPDGEVQFTLPKCGDCQAFIFDVVESSGTWLKIVPGSMVKRQEGEDEEYSPKYNGGELWIHSLFVSISLPQPGLFDVSVEIYSSPSQKSKIICNCMPDKILEISGKWVKVEGYVANIDEMGNSIKTNKRCSGWLYDPVFSCELCSA